MIKLKIQKSFWCIHKYNLPVSFQKLKKNWVIFNDNDHFIAQKHFRIFNDFFWFSRPSSNPRQNLVCFPTEFLPDRKLPENPKVARKPESRRVPSHFSDPKTQTYSGMPCPRISPNSEPTRVIPSPTLVFRDPRTRMRSPGALTQDHQKARPHVPVKS
jgi:hypothetical protein